MAKATGNMAAAAELRARIPMKMRLKAWWEGHELEVRRRQHDEEANQAPDDAVNAAPEQISASRRIEMTQLIWGEGMTSPGGEDFILHLVKPFALNPALTILDVTAGLGGPARTMVDRFGVWVKGLEADRELAEAGMELSTKSGMGKKAPIESFAPEGYEFKPKSVDCVFSKEGLFKIQDKRRLMAGLIEALKQRGQLIFTDYIRADEASDSAVAKWAQNEPSNPDPWKLSQYEDTLNEMRMDIRIKEDMTEQMKSMIRESWAGFTKLAQGKGIDPATAKFLADEAELWTRRYMAMEEGTLQVCRVHAIVPSGDKMLSDW